MPHSTNAAPILFIPHGGGPMPLLNEPNHRPLINFLKDIVTQFAKPKAILVISAHWENSVATVASTKKPDLIYDYYGFPKESYQIMYPATGQPGLAKKITELITAQGQEVLSDAQRDFDHGVFVPLKIMYPQADIPVVQLSLLKSMNAQAHIDLGKAIGELRRDGVLILGSGFSFHNMSAFMNSSPESLEKSEAFDTWLNHTLLSKELSFEQKEQALSQWENAPQARYCHPREEHLLPLHVCFGAAMSEELSAVNVFDESLLGAKSSGFMWL